MVLGMQDLCQSGILGTTSNKQRANIEKCPFIVHWMSVIGHFFKQNENAFYYSLIFVRIRTPGVV